MTLEALFTVGAATAVVVPRAIIPEGAIVRDIHLPRDEREPRIPNFTLVHPIAI